MIDIVKNKLRKVKIRLINYIYTILPPPGNSYAQAGEDAIIAFLLQEVGVEKPTYLELGTNVPDRGNNTYLFYKRGAKGILVEADETLIPEIKKVRPNDILLNIGVGTNEQAEADFYIFEINALNTFDREKAEDLINRKVSKNTKIARVQLKTINSILEENFTTLPDLLSIDIEGLDYAVLKTLDFEKYPIPIICAETSEQSDTHIKAKNKRIEELLSSKGYFVYGDTYINTIFVNRQWFTSIERN